jgi:hypothetical protein
VIFDLGGDLPSLFLVLFLAPLFFFSISFFIPLFFLLAHAVRPVIIAVRLTLFVLSDN